VPVVSGVALVLLCSVVAYAWVTSQIEAIEKLSESDPQAAIAQAAAILRGSTGGFAVALGALGLLLVRYFTLAQSQGKLPPEGWWSVGAFQRLEGLAARRIGAVGRVVSWLLVALAPLLVLAVDHLLVVLQGLPAE
jgi:hypothetical protein